MKVPIFAKHHSKDIPSLTGIRGLAAMLVVVAHLDILQIISIKSGFLGEIGVVIFFSLSGFLMAYLYLDKAFSRQAAIVYVLARFSRIAPAYLFTVCIAYFIYTFLDSEFIYPISNAVLLRHLLFSGNAAIFWSIPPEVQFYACFVVIWYAVWLSNSVNDRRYLLLVTIGCVLLYLFRSEVPGTFVGSKIHIFMAGVAAGCLRFRLKTDLVWKKLIFALQIVSIVMLALVSVDVVSLPFASKPELFASLSVAIASGVFVLLNSFPTRCAQAIFGNWFVQRCGECSFSVYLMHDPIIYWMKPLQAVMPSGIFLCLVGAAVFVVAYASYYFVELPGARIMKAAVGPLFASRFAPNPRV